MIKTKEQRKNKEISEIKAKKYFYLVAVAER